MFSGIGGFECGIQCAWMCLEDERQTEVLSSGNKERSVEQLSGCPLCVGYSEIDKYVTTIYKKHFGGHKEYGDCTKINWSEVEDFDFLVGGFPCQSFSIAGKREGFNDTRGTLFFEIARCLREKQPQFCVLENVKGLLSHDKGNTFFTILATLDELGYDCEWQVLNSKNFDVPQNRERVFIVGNLRGSSRRKIFPVRESSKFNNGAFTKRDNIAYCLQAGGDKHRGSYIKQLNHPKHSNNRVYSDKGISPSLNTAQGGNRQPFISSNEDINIRRLTPTECERLQGFPDGWTEGLSDTQKYKCLGNAVTTNVITSIFKRLLHK